MFKILCIILTIIIIITLLKKYNFIERFESDLLLTIPPVNIVSSNTIDNSIRNVMLNPSGDNLMYVSRNIPENGRPVPCPYFVDKSVTLGNHNFCWV